MSASKVKRRGPRLLPVELPGGEAKVYANARVADALQELLEDMTLYNGVRFAQVAEAIYRQGVRDGRRDVFLELQRLEDDPKLKYRNPGRPQNRPAPGR